MSILIMIIQINIEKTNKAMNKILKSLPKMLIQVEVMPMFLIIPADSLQKNSRKGFQKKAADKISKMY